MSTSAFSHKTVTQTEIHAVTGAFGYSGRYIARRLLAQKKTVRTLTNSVDKQNEFHGNIEIFPLTFDDPEQLRKSLTGVSVLYNTYWVRFNHRNFKHSVAVENTKKLFMAAKQVGIRRIVHTSITNPSEDSPLEYFSGKAILETELQQSGIAHSILRPTVLFGNEDILINNIAWLLRHFPIFGVFGDGQYKLQPVFVDDFAALAVEQGTQTDYHVIINTIGPETFTYRELVEVISQIVLGKKRIVISIPNELGLAVGNILGLFTGDVMITKAEIMGLRQNLLYVNTPPAGSTRLTDWLQEHRNTVGKNYASELKRRI
ncbi:MAG: NAD(P)H-binding protein [Planctomycetaceae bacterium]|jgi:NADH dehydrogenase|nr:NAD(P)H-binding protein [Planctomycetaceae bacterium]